MRLTYSTSVRLIPNIFLNTLSRALVFNIARLVNEGINMNSAYSDSVVNNNYVTLTLTAFSKLKLFSTIVFYKFFIYIVQTLFS